jgi:hypothetical protein
MKLKIILLITILSSTSIITGKTPSKYIRYKDSKYNLSILIPLNWRKSSSDLEYGRISTFSKGYYSKITLTTTVINEYERLIERKKWKNWKNWIISDKGYNLNVILDSKKHKTSAKISGRLIIFDYYSKKVHMLERIFISEFQDKIIVIKCESKLSTFYNHNKIFNDVMESLLVVKKKSSEE